MILMLLTGRKAEVVKFAHYTKVRMWWGINGTLLMKRVYVSEIVGFVKQNKKL